MRKKIYSISLILCISFIFSFSASCSAVNNSHRVASQTKKAKSSESQGFTGFLAKEMKTDGVKADSMRKYSEKVQKEIKAGNKKQALKIVADAIKDEYGITFWQLNKFKSSDGLIIPAFLTLPKGKKKAPAVVLVHGASYGSSSIFRKHAFLLAKKGYASFAVDYRSSVGHGDYLKNADDPGPGGKEFDDVMYAIDFL